MTLVTGYSPADVQSDATRAAARPSGLSIIRLLPAPMSELDWLDELLKPLNIRIEPYQEPVPIRPGAIYLYHSVQKLTLPPALLTAIRGARPAGLLHLGDEYLRTDLNHYAAFDFVIRMFPFSGSSHPGVFELPLGYTSGLANAPLRLASERKSLWMFAGDWKADRHVMARAFEKVPGGFLSLTRSTEGERGITRAEYMSQMSDAVFAPAPAGNIALETNRAYEALQLGAIPILPKRRYADAYRDVLGDHPLPDFESWAHAADYVRRFSQDKAGLDALQSECLDWWASEKEKVSRGLGDFIRAGLDGQHTDGLAERFSHVRTGGLNRIGTLLAQQNGQQIQARLSFEMRRLGTRLRGKPKLQGTWTFPAAETPPHANDEIRTPEKPSSPRD
jgi:hypothetical protein